MENEVKEKFLPLGTIVLLKGGKKKLMIMSYCVIPMGALYDKNGAVTETKMLDYGACTYPEGMITSDQMFAFDHEQIEKVCFVGYESDEQKEFNKYLLEHQDTENKLFEAIKKDRDEAFKKAQENQNK